MRRRPLAAVGVALTALATALLPGAVPAVAGAPAPSAHQPAAQAPTVRLLGRTPWVGDGLDFEVSLQAAAAPPGATVRLQVHDRVRSRSEFARTVDGADLRSVRWVDGPRPLATGAGPVTFTVPVADAPGRTVAPLDPPGVYPVSIDVFGPEGEVAASLHTHLVRLAPFDPGSEEQPLRVAVVARLGGEPVDTGPLSEPAPEAPDDLVATATSLSAALAAHPDLGINLSVLPENLGALAAAEPVLAGQLAMALTTSELLAEPWVAVDEAAWEAADSALLAQLRARGAGALEEVLGRPPGPVRLAGGADLASLRVAAAQGMEAVVVDEDDLEPLDTGDFPYTLARPFHLDLARTAADPDPDPDNDDDDEGPTVLALAADAALGEHAARAEADPVLAASLVLADLAVLADDEPSSARVATVRLPASASTSPEFLSTLLAGLEPPPAPPAPPPPTPDPETGEVPEPVPPTPPAAPRLVTTRAADAVEAVAHAGAGGILDGPEEPLVRRLLEPGDTAEVAALARALAAARVDLASYRTMVGDGDPVTDRAEAILDTAAADGLPSSRREAAVASVADHVDGQIERIEAPALQRVTLTDREGIVQLVFANDTGVAVDVRLEMRADRLRLLDAPDGTMEVRLEPDVTRVELHVEARSSGDAPLDIRVTSPDGRLEVAESRVAVRTTAVSGVGIVLMVGALGFLAVWWTRTILRERRGRRAPAHVRRS